MEQMVRDTQWGALEVKSDAQEQRRTICMVGGIVWLLIADVVDPKDVGRPGQPRNASIIMNCGCSDSGSHNQLQSAALLLNTSHNTMSHTLPH